MDVTDKHLYRWTISVTSVTKKSTGFMCPSYLSYQSFNVDILAEAQNSVFSNLNPLSKYISMIFMDF